MLTSHESRVQRKRWSGQQSRWFRANDVSQSILTPAPWCETYPFKLRSNEKILPNVSSLTTVQSLMETLQREEDHVNRMRESLHNKIYHNKAKLRKRINIPWAGKQMSSPKSIYNNHSPNVKRTMNQRFDKSPIRGVNEKKWVRLSPPVWNMSHQDLDLHDVTWEKFQWV